MNIQWDVGRYLSQWQQLSKNSQKAGSQFVFEKARSLVQKLAFKTPKAQVVNDDGNPVWKKNMGRAKAGWYAAAKHLGVGYIGTVHPDIGEGLIIDNSKGLVPHIIMTNSVPYINLIKGHGNWQTEAVVEEQARMMQQLEATYRKHLAQWL